MNSIADRNKERNYLFDNMKGLLIFLVVFAHILNIPDHPYDLAKALYTFIYFFHMPAFIFIAGYFSKNAEKCRDTALQNLFIPYCILNILIYAQEYLIWRNTTELEIRILEPMSPYRFFSPAAGCWFLFAMFVWKLLLKDIIKLRFCIPILFLLGLGAGFTNEFALRFSLSRIAVFTVFYVIGYYAKEIHIKWIRAIPKWIYFVISAAVFALSWFLVNVKSMARTSLLCNHPYVNGEEIEDMLVRLMFYIVACIMTIALTGMMSEKKSFLSQIGKHSLVVYIMHLFVDRVAQVYLEPLLSPWIGSLWGYMAYVTIISIIIVYVFSRNIVMEGYNRFMNGVNRIIFRTR